MTNFKPNSEIKHFNARVDPKVASLRGLFNRAKNNAKKRKISWNLSFDAFTAVILCSCFWCDAAPISHYNVSISTNGYTQRKSESYLTKHGWITHNGLDRIENTMGYELKNVIPACKYCNFARNDRTVLEFKEWIEKISTYQKSLFTPTAVA